MRGGRGRSDRPGGVRGAGLGAVVVAALVGGVLAWSVPAALTARTGSLPGSAGPPWPAADAAAGPERAASDDGAVPRGEAVVAGTPAGTGEAVGAGPAPAAEGKAGDAGAPAGDTSAGGLGSAADPLPASAGPVLANGQAEAAPATSVLPGPAPGATGPAGPAATGPTAPAAGFDPSDYSVEVVYAVPQDAPARGAVPATLALSVEAMQRLVAAALGGRTFRVVRANGTVAVRTLRLAAAEAEVASPPGGVRRRVESDLAVGGASPATRLYAVFYDGTGVPCDAPSPSAAAPHVALVSLRSPCGGPAPGPAMAGELARQLGASPACLASGTCGSLGRSVFLDPLPPSPALPTAWTRAV